MMLPRAASLTLSGDGFEWCHIYRRVRASWRQASDFAVEDNLNSVDSGGTWLRDRIVHFQFVESGLPPGTPSGPEAVRGMLPDTYGLGASKLAELMNAWRAKALANDRPADSHARPWG